MSYSNDQTEIRAGLVNYIGAMINASPYDNPDVIKHNVIAILLEEAMNLAKDENGHFNMYACKPILRLTSGIAKQRHNLLSDISDSTNVKKQLSDYQQIVTILDEIIKNTQL